MIKGNGADIFPGGGGLPLLPNTYPLFKYLSPFQPHVTYNPARTCDLAQNFFFFF